MEASKQFLKDNNISQFISFQDGLPHTVKLMKDKVDSMPDRFGENGGKIQGMKYLVQEGGEQKTFFTTSIGLISKLAEFESGSVVTIQMKKKKVNGQPQSYFLVSEGTAISDTDEAEEDVIGDDEEVPVDPTW